MQFKTAAEIRAEREAAGKDAEREEKRKAKLAEKAQRKYDRMAEESAKREAARKAQAPKLVVNRENVIVAPALLAEVKPERQPAKQVNFGTAQIENAVAQRGVEQTKKERQEQKNRDFAKNYGTTSMPKAESKQVWDEATKQWVKR